MSSAKKYDTQTPYIACFAVCMRDGKIAMVLRKNTSWMDGYWGLAAGKVEVGESFLAGTAREAKEELGVSVAEEDLEHYITVHRKDTSSEKDLMEWVDIYFITERWEGEVTNAEPHMHERVEWFDIDDLPEKTIPAVRASLEAARRGESYLEYGWK